MTDSAADDLLVTAEQFLQYLRVERRLSPVTITNYRRQLTALAEMMAAGKLRCWAQLEPATVRMLAAKSRRNGLQPASLALRLSALRSFLDWQVSNGLLPANPAKAVSAPKQGRHLPKNMDVDDITRLMDISSNDPLTVRDRTMLEVMYGAGLRLSELVGLNTGGF